MKKRNKHRQRCYAVVSLAMAVLIGSIFGASGQQLQERRPELVLQIGHSAEISSVACSPDGTSIASGSHDGTVKLWNRITGEMRRTLAGHQMEVACIAFSRDGSVIASGSKDATV